MTVTNNAMQDAQVLYVNSWASAQFYGNRRAEDKIKPELGDWCVDEPWFENTASNCRFMHCLPIRRGVTVTDRILGGPRSVIIVEARNRMLVQMALLHQILSSS